MSHDFAKKQKKKVKSPNKRTTRSQPEKKTLPRWVWFFAGVIITLFIQLLIHLAKMDAAQKPTQTPSKPAINWPKKPQQAETKKPDMQFYDMLKDQEVKVSDKVVQDRDDGSYDFSLQAGSFRKEQDAEQLRAEIILLGMEAEIKKTTRASGSVWYRVIVGPFNSRSLFAKSRSILLDNGIRSIKVKNS